jgi:hypothetical protein
MSSGYSGTIDTFIMPMSPDSGLCSASVIIFHYPASITYAKQKISRQNPTRVLLGSCVIVIVTSTSTVHLETSFLVTSVLAYEAELSQCSWGHLGGFSNVFHWHFAAGPDIFLYLVGSFADWGSSFELLRPPSATAFTSEGYQKMAVKNSSTRAVHLP